jgi:hypothetical protein
MPFNENGTTTNGLIFENDNHNNTFGNEFVESYSPFEKVFLDTYIAIGKNNSQIQHSAYSELNINSEYGVVAFRDANNDLWVLDRIEE